MPLERLRRQGTDRVTGIDLPEEWREADLRRAFRPGTWPYLGFLTVNYFATDYPRVHPRVFWCFGAIVLALSAYRFLLVSSTRLRLAEASTGRKVLFSLLVLSGLVWGMFLATTLQLYRFNDPAPLLIIICTVG